MPSAADQDLKLMTLLLGRTGAGCASVSPFLWGLLSPPSARRRFKLFNLALVYHRMLYSAEFRVRAEALLWRARLASRPVVP